MQFQEIHFGGNNPKLHSYKKYKWQPGETRIVEFYPNENVPVTLLYSTDPSLYEKLCTLIDGHPISIDLEWALPWNHSPHPIELFQFSSSKGTIVVATDQNKGYDQIAKFLHSSTFFGKGMYNDKKKLQQCLNENFDEIEDIEQTRLLPNNLTLNFESLIMTFLGPGTAKFKDHRVQTSNWSIRPLSILQVLYGAHDSYSMLQVYKKIIEKFGPEIKKVPVKPKTVKNKKKFKTKRVIHECGFINIDGYFNENGIDIDYEHWNENDSNKEDEYDEFEKLCEEKPSLKELLFQYEKKKGVVDDDDKNSCFINYADQVLMFLLSTTQKDKRFIKLERICLASDLLFLGIVHCVSDGSFVCQVCDKNFRNPTALISHSDCCHHKDSYINHKLNSKDVLLHYLTATDQVKCPFKVVFEDSQLKNMTVEVHHEEEEGEEEYDDDDDDDDDDILFNNKIVPKSYVESDGIKCCICDNLSFDSVENLRNHCWLNHYDVFVNLVSGKEFENENENVDNKFNSFGLFCFKKLKMASFDIENLMIKCSLCKCLCISPEKFFMHLFFKHQGLVIVNKEQYNKWPIKFSEFNKPMVKMVNNFFDDVKIEELEKSNIYDKNENKCKECNVLFNNDDERLDHYMHQHLIYFPSPLLKYVHNDNDDYDE